MTLDRVRTDTDRRRCSFRQPAAALVVSSNIRDRLSFLWHHMAHDGGMNPTAASAIATHGADYLGFLSSHNKSPGLRAQPDAIAMDPLRRHADGNIPPG